MLTCITNTQLGTMRAAAEDNSLMGLWFTGQKYYPQNTEAWTEANDYPVFVRMRAWLKDYFTGKKPGNSISLAPNGTEFQKKVWQLLLEIPFGSTTSYGAISSRLVSLGIKASAQAVGGAVGHNPISILIPCHRVLGADGSLTGYAGGIEKKRALLELEGATGFLQGVLSTSTTAPDKLPL